MNTKQKSIALGAVVVVVLAVIGGFVIAHRHHTEPDGVQIGFDLIAKECHVNINDITAIHNNPGNVDANGVAGWSIEDYAIANSSRYVSASVDITPDGHGASQVWCRKPDNTSDRGVLPDN